MKERNEPFHRIWKWNTVQSGRYISCFAAVVTVVLFTVLLSNQLYAQGNLRHYKLRVGFYGGPVSYIGDYNPWVLGSPYQLTPDLEAPSEFHTGKINFGLWTKLMLKPFLYVRADAQFGSLTYKWPELDYLMNNSYRGFGIGLEAVAFPEKRLNPYLALGIKHFSYELPPKSDQQLLEPYTFGELGTRRSSLAIPAAIGFSFQASRLSSVFVEAGVDLSMADDIDNLSLPTDQSDMMINNDALLSVRAGLSVSLIDLLNLKTPDRNPKPALAYSSIQTSYEAELQKVPPMEANKMVPQDSIDAAWRRINRPEYLVSQSDDEDDKEQKVIEVVDPENREFERESEVERVQRMQEQLEEQVTRGEIQNPEEIRRRVPRIIIKPDPIDLPVDERGIIAGDPPEGYYVQVYASVGPISAQRARRMAMRELQDILESPKQQVIITKREQFYEVRIGVFDSYDDTIGVLEEIQGTFVDAYTLIFVPDEED